MNLRKTNNSLIYFALILIIILLIINLLVELLDLKFSNTAKDSFLINRKHTAVQTSSLTKLELKEFSKTLQKYGLVEESVEIIKNYLETFNTNSEEKAENYYQIALRLLETKKHKKSLFYLLKAKLSSDNAKLLILINDQLTICFQQLGIKDDDQLDGKKLNTVYAKINGKEIDEQDFELILNNLPLSLRNNVKVNLDEKKRFLRFVVILHILYEESLKRFIDNDPEIIAEMRNYQFFLMVQTSLLIFLKEDLIPENKEIFTFLNDHCSEFLDENDAKLLSTQACQSSWYQMVFTNEHLSVANLLKEFAKKYKIEIYDDEL